MLCLREKKPSDLVNVSLVFWVTAAEQNASNAGKQGWAPGQKRVAGLREAQAGAGLSGARPKADPCLSQTVLPGSSQELIPSQTLKGRAPSRASPRTCPDRRALARSRAAPVRTRERAVPEAGHAVAGISPASGFFCRALSASAFSACGACGFPARSPTPNAALGQTEAAAEEGGGAAPGKQPELLESLRTHGSPEGARAALEGLAAPVLAPAGRPEDSGPVAFSTSLLSRWFPRVLRAHFGSPR